MLPGPDRPASVAHPSVAHPSVTAAMVVWRVAHPHATFAEIEVEATRQVAALRVDLIAAAVAVGEPTAAPACGACGRTMVRNGTRERTIVTSHREPVTVQDHRYRCSACGVELSPPR